MVEKLGGKNDLKAMTNIIRKAARTYKTFDKMIPELSGIFLGIEESNAFTIKHARDAAGCDAVGRDTDACASNAWTGSFGDTGFHADFRDGFSQPFHFWAYVATAANTEGMSGAGSYMPGLVVGHGANIYHEMLNPENPQGATWQDYALSQVGMNIGTMSNMGLVKPSELADTIEYFVGAYGPGMPSVNILIPIFPLPGN